MLEYAEVKRASGITCDSIVWYEDLSSSCSFWGNAYHAIDKCPLLNAPQREVKVCLLKNQKQKSLTGILSKASMQYYAGTWAENTNLVPEKPKPW